MIPPAAYDQWWAMVEDCSGIRKPFAAVSWYSAPPGSLRTKQDPTTGAYWSAKSNRIVLDSTFLLRGGLVRHEMLHSILGQGTHPRDAFLGRCGGAVDCIAQCLADAGPPPPFKGEPISAESLTVTVDVSPDAPSASVDYGLFWVTVTATNPKSVPVIAVLTTVGRSTRPFRVFLQHDSGGTSSSVTLFDSSLVEFQPGETKRHVFDFRAGSAHSGGDVAPGTLTVGGAYGGRWVTSSVNIEP
jgi:hypothetical protein